VPSKLSQEYFCQQAVVLTCCGHGYSTAVTQHGHLYTWGDGKCPFALPKLLVYTSSFLKRKEKKRKEKKKRPHTTRILMC